MCEFNHPLKLCTCDAEQLEYHEIDWLLRRKEKGEQGPKILGKAFIPQLSEKELKTRAQLLDLLNSNNCFDFEYQPQTDDFLRIRTGKKPDNWLAFRYQNKAWQIDESTKFATWRQQLGPFLEGKIKA